jgi:hypothetical protein
MIYDTIICVIKLLEMGQWYEDFLKGFLERASPIRLQGAKLSVTRQTLISLRLNMFDSVRLIPLQRVNKRSLVTVHAEREATVHTQKKSVVPVSVRKPIVQINDAIPCF